MISVYSALNQRQQVLVDVIFAEETEMHSNQMGTVTEQMGWPKPRFPLI